MSFGRGPGRTASNSPLSKTPADTTSTLFRLDLSAWRFRIQQVRLAFAFSATYNPNSKPPPPAVQFNRSLSAMLPHDG